MDKQPDSNNLTDYKFIVELLDDAVIVLDSGQHITYLNPMAEDILQLSANQAIGNLFTDIIAKQCQVTLSLNRLPDTPIAFKIKDKTEHYTLKHKPLPNNKGSLITCHLANDWHKSSTELRRLQVKYSDFAHTVSHDVKSPLGVAIGYSNMLQADLEPDTEARLFADEIFETSMRIMYICNELVVLAELGQAEPIDISSINLRVSIDNTLRRFSKELATQNITIDTPESIPLVRGNASWVDEVMMNFMYYIIHELSNVKKIVIDAKIDEDNLRLRITHNGDPIPSDIQVSLFKVIHPLDQIRAEGHGLGMGVARLLIERLSGTVDIEDGYTLYFLLPIDD